MTTRQTKKQLKGSIVLDFPRWKFFTVLGTCLVFILLALPNLLTEKNREKWPSFLPSQTVNLGLDLQGGSYLLLELQFDRYFHDQTLSLLDDVRKELLSQKVGYKDLKVVGNKVQVTLLNSASDEASKAISDIKEKERVQYKGVRAYKSGAGSFTSSLEGVDVKDIFPDVLEIGYTESSLTETRRHLLEQSIEIVNRRVNETGTREPIIQRQGDNRIVLQVPGLQDPERLKALLGKTAKMTFHLLDDSVDPFDLRAGKVPAGSRIVYGEEKDVNGKKLPVPYAIKSQVMLSGDALVDASATFDNQTNEPEVSFRFNAAGAKKFGEITSQHVGKRFATVLDDKVITAPVIRGAILGGSGVITGNFTSESANDLAVLLRAGALPVPLKVIEERSVGPSLGADSIDAGKRAALLGVVLVMGWMLINYGLFGVFADIALLFNIVFIIGALSLFQATLTMPGIAGMVLTLGMAVDANVLIYERIREELRNGKSPFAAIDNGFRIARQTIFDSNVTTLIAALLLFYFGTGTVKGFAVTLAIGILASMFTAIMLTRLMVAVWLRRTRPKVVPI
jgi:protein-export membrane protein SecD